MSKFGERLRLLRTSRDLSQLDLAKQLKISKSSVNMYERGEREPGLVMLEVIADFFNVDLDYLLGKTEQQNRNAWLGQFSINSAPIEPNMVRIAARNGSYRELVLTDSQMEELISILDNMQDVADDI